METIDITKLRKRLGDISQADLGKRLGGLSQSAVSRMETGETAQDGPVLVLLNQLWETTEDTTTESPTPADRVARVA